MSLKNAIMLSSLILACTLVAPPAFSQQDDSSSQDRNSQSQDKSEVEGTVVASSRTSFVVRSDDGQFHVFTFDQDTNKPSKVGVGSQVRVNSDEGDRTGARHATDVTVTQEAQGSGTATTGSGVRKAAPVPASVRNVENQIQHEARRWRMGDSRSPCRTCSPATC